MSEAIETKQYYNEREVIREAMRILGSRTSERKRASSKANAKRPRKRRKRLVGTPNASTPQNN